VVELGGGVESPVDRRGGQRPADFGVPALPRPVAHHREELPVAELLSGLVQHQRRRRRASRPPLLDRDARDLVHVEDGVVGDPAGTRTIMPPKAEGTTAPAPRRSGSTRAIPIGRALPVVSNMRSVGKPALLVGLRNGERTRR
jgi:hypothetical protein